VYGNDITLNGEFVDVHIDTAVLVIVSVIVWNLQYVKLWACGCVDWHNDAGDVYFWCLVLTVR
jgi:hypothetical protein